MSNHICLYLTPLLEFRLNFPNFLPNPIEFAQIQPILPPNFFLGDEAASPAQLLRHWLGDSNQP